MSTQVVVTFSLNTSAATRQPHFSAVYTTTRTLRTTYVFIRMVVNTLLILFPQLLSMKRVGILHGGMQHGLQDKSIPPAQRLRIAKYNELGGSPYNSSTAVSDGEGMLG